MHEKARVDTSLNAIQPHLRTGQLLQEVAKLNNGKYPDFVTKTIIGAVTLKTVLFTLLLTCLEHCHD
jgi:hypothetical protein